jgi:3'(2'), 5'-bisphosphate nucleotidase
VEMAWKRGNTILNSMPSSLRDGPDALRLWTALNAAESAGAAIMTLRNREVTGIEAQGGQLKTPVDQAAEGWVLGYLRHYFPDEAYLAEESYEGAGGEWTPVDSYWTIDALDGTRSFIDGYDGFCVQIAYVKNGTVALGLVHEPVRRLTYLAMAGKGAHLINKRGEFVTLSLNKTCEWPDNPIFVDSRRPNDIVGETFNAKHGSFLECGSFGLKICRVADGSAHVFAKQAAFKIWDVAPGDVIVTEAGGRLGLWSGVKIPYFGDVIYFENLVAAPASLFELVIDDLGRVSRSRALDITRAE